MKHFITVVSFCIAGALSVYAQAAVKHGDRFCSPMKFCAQNDQGNGGTGLAIVDASSIEKQPVVVPETTTRVTATTSIEAALIMAHQVGEISFIAVRDILNYASMVHLDGSFGIDEVRAKASYHIDVFKAAFDSAYVVYKKALFDNQSAQNVVKLALILEAFNEFEESLNFCQEVLKTPDNIKDVANKALFSAKKGKKFLGQAQAHAVRDIMDQVIINDKNDSDIDATCHADDRAVVVDIINLAAQSIIQLHERAVVAAQESFALAAAVAANAKLADLDIAFQKVQLANNILWAAARDVEFIALQILNNKQTSKMSQLIYAMRSTIERGKFIALIIARVCEFAEKGMAVDAARVAAIVLEHARDMEASVDVVCELVQHGQKRDKALEIMPIEAAA